MTEKRLLDHLYRKGPRIKQPSVLKLMKLSEGRGTPGLRQSVRVSDARRTSRAV